MRATAFVSCAGPGRFLASALTAGLIVAVALPAQRTLHIQDGADVEALAVSDARALEVIEENDELKFAVTMAAPIATGMFTCVHVFVDCDGRGQSGLNGAELWIRASIGSRYWPNDAQMADGEQSPSDLLRTTGSEIDGDHGRRAAWVHTIRTLPAPEIDGATIRFHFPVEIVRRQVRYQGDYRLRVDVETSCSDRPLVVDHRIRDEGLAIAIDGSLADWRGGDRLEDAGGELHASTRALDLRSVQVEHGAGNVLLGVRFDQPGFGIPTDAADVSVRDALHVFVDAPFPRYQEPATIVVPQGLGEQRGLGWRAVAVDDVVEVEIDRQDEQRRLLLHVWTDAERHDYIGSYAWTGLGGTTR